MTHAGSLSKLTSRHEPLRRGRGASPAARYEVARCVDYRDYFSHALAQDVIVSRYLDVVSVQSESGHAIRSAPSDHGGFLEYCSFLDDVMVVVSEAPNGLAGRTVQTTTGGDWLHVQFRIAGSGSESIGGSEAVRTPTGCCAIIRTPSGSETFREFDPSGAWSAVCLYMRPSSISRFFGLSEASFSDRFKWMQDADEVGFRSHVMALDVRMHSIVRDIQTNPFDGEFRRSFLKAKTLELFATTVHRLAQCGPGESEACLRAADYQKLKRLNDIVSSDVDSTMTLGSLARQVGTNRTHLSEIFKECNGVTVQAYRRKLRLDEAMKMLSSQRVQVSEVAAKLGYSSVSSLSRAFTREFGVSPKDVRPSR